MPTPVRRRRPAKKRPRTIVWPGLAVSALLAGTTAGCGYVHAGAAAADGTSASGTSSLAPPEPEVIATATLPAAKARPASTASGSASAAGTPASAASSGSGSSVQDYEGSLVLDEAGSALTSWNETASYCPANTGMLANGTVGTDAGEATLTTPGKPGSCVALISPGTYSSDVIEADVYFPALPGKPGTIANWDSVWLTNGPVWPEDGELDAAEVEPVNAENSVTWHSGTRTDLFSASTSGFAPVQLPADSANLSPGWHVVDVVYTKGFFAVYYDGQEFSSYTSSNIPGSPLNLYFTMGDTPATSSIEQSIGGAPINSASSPVTMSVKYLKIWSYR